MKSKNILQLEQLLERNLLPYMEVIEFQENSLDLKIQVYYPKIVKTLCELLDKEFDLLNKQRLIISRNEKGFHFVDISFVLNKKRVLVRLESMLKYTWGVA